MENCKPLKIYLQFFQISPSKCQQQLLPLSKIRFDEKLMCFRGQKVNKVFNSKRYLFSEASIVWSCSGQFVHQFHKSLQFTESMEHCIPIVTVHLTCSSLFTCQNYCRPRYNWLFSRILGTFCTKHKLLGLPL